MIQELEKLTGIAIKLLIIVLPSLILSTCNKPTSWTADCLNGSPSPIEITIDDLHANPKHYNGKIIELSGYYVYEFENIAIYPSRFSTDPSYAIWIKSTKTKDIMTDNRGVRVVGKFNAGFKGHLNQFLGSLEEICFDR